MVSFDVTPEDRKVIDMIVLRGIVVARDNRIDYPAKDMTMDLTACHANGCPLDLPKMLKSGDANFGHDLFGIRRFLDRHTGKIPANKFHPRCGAPDEAETPATR